MTYTLYSVPYDSSVMDVVVKHINSGTEELIVTVLSILVMLLML